MTEQIQPQPVPTLVGVGKTVDGKMVVMRFDTPTGTAIYFLDETLAANVGNRLIEATSTIVRPPAGISLAQQLVDTMSRNKP